MELTLESWSLGWTSSICWGTQTGLHICGEQRKHLVTAKTTSYNSTQQSDSQESRATVDGNYFWIQHQTLTASQQIYSRLTLWHILYATILTNHDRLSSPIDEEEPILASHGWICCYSIKANWKLCFSVFVPNGAIWFPLRICSSIPIYLLTFGIGLTHMT